MNLTLTAVRDLGGDVLEATCVDEAGNEYTGRGWVSATSNHFDPTAYGPDGHLLEQAQPRAMTAAEVGEYALRLVLDQNQLTPAAAPAAEISFAALAPVALADPPEVV